MMRKSLLLILALAFSSVPVFLMAHALTHFAPVDAINITEAGGVQTGSDADPDVDDICFDCLALTALSIIFITSGFFLVDQIVRRLLAQSQTVYDPDNRFSPYYSRAPPFNTSSF